MRPYIFTGTWSDTNADEMRQAMRQLGHSGDVEPDFNQWTFYTDGSNYIAWRRTWGIGPNLRASSVQGLIERVTTFYSRFDC